MRPLYKDMTPACVAAVIMFVVSPAAAQHHHPPQDEALHEKFYSTWFMPDSPAKSCCNKADCYPTEIKYVGGEVHARRREDGKYILSLLKMNRGQLAGDKRSVPPRQSHAARRS